MDAILQLDQNILLFIQEYIRHDWMDWFWKGITHLGDFGIFWILLTIVLLIPKKTRKAGLASAVLPTNHNHCGVGFAVFLEYTGI